MVRLGTPVIILCLLMVIRSTQLRLFTSANGGVWATITGVETDPASPLAYAWINTPTVIGPHEVTRFWLGDKQDDGSDMTASFSVGKSPSSISIEMISTSITFGRFIWVTGFIVPAKIHVPVKLAFAKPDGTVLPRTVISSTDGSFRDFFISDQAGTWTTKASWLGDDENEGAESAILTFRVNKVQINITISVSKDVIEQGQAITTSGLLSPFPGQVQVDITYTKPNGAALTRSVTVSSDGSFTDTFTPDGAGQWAVTTSWPGNENYLGASSSSLSFSVKQPFPVAILGAFAVVVLGAILLYLRSRSKSGPLPRPPSTLPHVQESDGARYVLGETTPEKGR